LQPEYQNAKRKERNVEPRIRTMQSNPSLKNPYIEYRLRANPSLYRDTVLPSSLKVSCIFLS